MFGGSTGFSSPPQQTTGSSIFGSSGFGIAQQSPNATSSPSTFGGSFSQATSNAPFGSTAGTFGSPVR